MLNAGWNWLFFKARRPRWALAEILLMEVSTLDLTRRAAHVDRAAERMFIPYAGWVAFATALNASIARRNPIGPP
jgi:tryptophan-rich sensory protein